MKNCFSMLSFWGILLAMPLTAGSAPVHIYVLNLEGSNVSVIDPATDQVVHTIKVPWPRGATFSPDGSRAYISSEDEHTLDVVDTTTYEITQKVHLSGHPSGSLVITTDGKYVLVPLNPFYGLALTKHHDPEDGGGIDIIDTTSLTRVKTIHIPEAIHDLFRTPDGKFALAGSATTSFVTVIDLHTLEPAWKIPFDTTPLTMAIESGPDGSTSRVFVELKNLRGFAVVDFAKRQVVSTIQFPEADEVKYGFAAYANKAHGAAQGITPVEYNPTHGTDITPDGKDLWVCSRGTNYLYVYSLPDLKLVGHVFLPTREKPAGDPDAGDPHWVAFTPDGKTAYIDLAHFDTVVAIDVATLKEKGQIAVGYNPMMVEVQR